MTRNILLAVLVVALLAFSACQSKVDSDPAVPPEDNVVAGTPEDNVVAGPSEDGKDVETPEGTGTDVQTPQSELSSIIKQIYEIKNPDLALGDIPVDLANGDSIKYYTGLGDISKVKDVAVSEAMIGSQAYSLVLVQVNQPEDSETVAEEMLNGIDQRKWVCVEADDLQIVAQDDVIMLFMVSSQLSDTVTSQEIVDAFKEVRGGKLDIELEG